MPRKLITMTNWIRQKGRNKIQEKSEELVQQMNLLITSYHPFYTTLGFGLQPWCYLQLFPHRQQQCSQSIQDLKKKVYRSTYAKITLNPPVSCNGGAKTSPLLGDTGNTAIALWEMCSPVQARLPPGGDGSSHLLFQSLIFNRNNVTGIIMRSMKERNILTPRIYTPSTASISCLFFFFKSSNS